MKIRFAFIVLFLLVVCAGTVRAGAQLTSYQVKPGDGLDSIARQFHTSRKTLARINGIRKLDDLRAGKTLCVPAVSTVETPAMDAPLVKPATPSHVTAPALQGMAPVPARAIRPRLKLQYHTTLLASSEAPVVSVLVAKPKAVAAVALAKPKAAKVAKPVAAAKSGLKPFLKDYEEPRKDTGEAPMGRVIVDLIVKLGIVLGIAYLSIYALRWVMGKQSALPGRKGQLKVLESASLGPNRSIHLVRVGEHVMVLGSTPDQITTISQIEDPKLLAQLSPELHGFSEQLSGAMSGEKPLKQPEPAELAAQVHGGISHLWNRVQEIRGLRGWKGGVS